MRYAKSAKVLVALGATLVAATSPVLANVSFSSTGGIDGGAINGIDGGAINGIDGGAINGIDGGAINGIDGGAINGIDGGAINGIDGGAINGIDGGAINGIDGGAINGIDGGAINGIDGGAIAGIDGGAINGIDGGAINGIDGGAINGIDGGAINGIDGGAINGIDGGAINGIDGGAILAGPISSIDTLNGVFESLGQVVVASQHMLSRMNVGDFVTVEGSVMAPGWLYADAVAVSAIRYVPGSTEVFVSGMLTSINAQNGTARMGNLTIDYTPSLGGSVAPSGLMWSFRGIQPGFDGVMISDQSGNIR
jgi:hypothetical protein